MLKRLAVHVLLLTGFASSAVAAPMMQLKDVSWTMTDKDTMEVNANGEKITLEKVNDNSFKVNSQLVKWDKNDTFDGLQKKIEKAYAVSKKKAALEEAILPRAHAFWPLLITALLGGGLGFMFGKSMCPQPSTATMPDIQPENTFQ